MSETGRRGNPCCITSRILYRLALTGHASPYLVGNAPKFGISLSHDPTTLAIPAGHVPATATLGFVWLWQRDFFFCGCTHPSLWQPRWGKRSYAGHDRARPGEADALPTGDAPSIWSRTAAPAGRYAAKKAAISYRRRRRRHKVDAAGRDLTSSLFCSWIGHCRKTETGTALPVWLAA